MSDNYTIQEWQKLTPIDNNEIDIKDKSIPHKLRKKSFMNCF